MIELQLEPYCEFCEEFDSDQATMYRDTGDPLTIVKCRRADICRKIYQQLEIYHRREIAKEKNHE